MGCGDFGDDRSLLAAGTIRSVDGQGCVSDGWRGVLTQKDVVSSLTYGSGLDDLPDSAVSDLVRIAADCVPDEQWWKDDIALEIDGQHGLDGEQAACVAEAYVSTLGIETAIRRRVFTLPVLALPPDDQRRSCALEDREAGPRTVLSVGHDASF